MSRPTRLPLSEADRARVRLLVELRGESRAAALLGVERRTLARCLAGLPLYPGTLALVTQRLAEIRPEAA
jgi:hypothetical protein